MALVSGESMTPTLRPGDRLWVDYHAAPAPGQVVVARLADGTVAVKRAHDRRTTATGRPAWWVLSDAPDKGVDSRHRGPVPDDDVLGVVRARLWPRPTRRLEPPA
ncbi:S24/S26 family peptidase [Nocardioides bruguierae]|uniref:S24/S26 family peptidase n=1 Tax=Nocardioides bruguierae TaxID=2945102 RepID=UPI00202013D8|nr:S24/S26 family peptidase [Nocardioides bruguierae]MCL8024806.1 S24/S26 family peptidase [Nocardioides bruguierae]